MKKIKLLLLTSTAIVGLAGCSNSSGPVVYGPSSLETQFIQKIANSDGSESLEYGFSVEPSDSVNDISGTLTWTEAGNADSVDNFIGFSIDNSAKKFVVTKKKDFSKQAKLLLYSESYPKINASVSIDLVQKHNGFKEGIYITDVVTESTSYHKVTQQEGINYGSTPASAAAMDVGGMGPLFDLGFTSTYTIAANDISYSFVTTPADFGLNEMDLCAIDGNTYDSYKPGRNVVLVDGLPEPGLSNYDFDKRTVTDDDLCQYKVPVQGEDHKKGVLFEVADGQSMWVDNFDKDKFATLIESDLAEMSVANRNALSNYRAFGYRFEFVIIATFNGKNTSLPVHYTRIFPYDVTPATTVQAASVEF